MISHEHQLERKLHILSACMGLMPLLPFANEAACLQIMGASVPVSQSQQQHRMGGRRMWARFHLKTGEEKARVEAIHDDGHVNRSKPIVRL
jgi:hypothetical protein